MMSGEGSLSVHAGALACVLALVVAAMPAAGPALAARHRPCPPLGARVFARDASVAVYSLEAEKLGAAAEACAIASGSRMTLLPGRAHRPRFPLVGGIFGIVLAGPLVAFEVNTHGVDSGSEYLEIVDVARRIVLREIPDVGRYVDAGVLGFRSITQLVLSRSGSAAWITEQGRRLVPEPQAPLLQVYLAPAGGGPVQELDEGPDIGPESLSLSGGTLSWWHAGTLHTAPIP
jgi:hypothetical protein